MGRLLARATKTYVDIESWRRSRGLSREWKAANRADVDELRTELAAFEQRLGDKWAFALDFLDVFWIRCYEVGAAHHERETDEAVVDEDATFHALTALHGRACRVASETRALIRTGHAEGAMGRWRTLHEIAVTMDFLHAHDEDIARRYLAHGQAREVQAMAEYDKFAERLGTKPFSVKDHEDAAEDRRKLIDQYGEVFVEEYGWASPAFPLTRKGEPARPRFADLEAMVDMDHHRPWYRFASHGSHAGAHPLGHPLPMSDASGAPINLAGPSDMGLVEPGTGTVGSLLVATVSFLNCRASLDSLAAMKALLRFSAQATDGIHLAYEAIDYSLGNQTPASRWSPPAELAT